MRALPPVDRLGDRRRKDDPQPPNDRERDQEARARAGPVHERWDVVAETLSGPDRQDGVVRGRPRRVANFVKTDPKFLATLPECFYDLPDGVTSYDEAVAYDREHANDEDANAKAGMSEEATA